MRDSSVRIAFRRVLRFPITSLGLERVFRQALIWIYIRSSSSFDNSACCLGCVFDLSVAWFSFWLFGVGSVHDAVRELFAMVSTPIISASPVSTEYGSSRNRRLSFGSSPSICMSFDALSALSPSKTVSNIVNGSFAACDSVDWSCDGWNARNTADSL